MKVIVTGSTGLVGRALIRSLLAEGHEVTRLVRGDSQGFRAPGTAAVHWDPERGEIDAQSLEGHDAAVHLAGENVGEGRWDEEKKRRILESRVKGTGLLAGALAGLGAKPGVLVSASVSASGAVSHLGRWSVWCPDDHERDPSRHARPLGVAPRNHYRCGTGAARARRPQTRGPRTARRGRPRSPVGSAARHH